jgi:hypothetical protein
MLPSFHTCTGTRISLLLSAFSSPFPSSKPFGILRRPARLIVSPYGPQELPVQSSPAPSRLAPYRGLQKGLRWAHLALLGLPEEMRP